MKLIPDKPCISRTTSNITKYIDTVLDLCEARGFIITDVHGDNQFNINTLKANLIPIFTDIYGKDEHVGIIEWIIKVIKDRARCTCHAIPYKYCTKLKTQ